MRTVRLRLLPVLVVGPLAACDDATSPVPVASIELSATSVTIGPTQQTRLTAVVRGTNGKVLDRPVHWRSADHSVATIDAAGQLLGIAFGAATVTASVDDKSADATVTVTATSPAHLAGTWRMDSFDGRKIPATYWYEEDTPIDDDGNVADVEIRLDSARMDMRADALYPFRQYCFTELHDTAPRFRYCWGDHGSFSVAQPGAVVLVSEYIQNLSATGTVTLAGTLALTEPLWISETPRATVWVRTH